jgi:two-component system, OmpR family, phosphate regulon sensor histidine kinase PhoR
MRGIKISWLVGIIAVAVIGVSFLQVKWLSNALELRQQVFDQTVEQSLNTISDWIMFDAQNLELTPDSSSFSQGQVLIADGMQNQSRGVLLRMESLPMDSLVALALAENGVTAKAVYGAFDRYGQPAYLEGENEIYREELIGKGYEVALGPLQLRVFFPNLKKYLLESQLGAFVLSGFMLLVIAIGLIYVMKSVVKSKELVRIRRDLMNNLTHELKTPISTIGLASEALGDKDLDLNEEQTSHYIGMIRGENKRLGVLVEKVLQASLTDSKSMKLYLQQVNVHDLIKEVVRNVTMQVRRKGGKIDLNIMAENPIIQADSIHLTNVIFNLIDNAIKYSPDGAQIEISSSQTEEGVELRFRDKGLGIPKEFLGKVFERLFRVPTGNVHDVKGFGLGLSYVKNVVERHHGTIYAESEHNDGSTFVMKLKSNPNPLA